MPPASTAIDQSDEKGATGAASPYRIDRRRMGLNGKCSICRHSARAQIELAMARGGSRRSVGDQYGVSPNAVYRHFNDHVSKEVKASLLAQYLKPSATIESIMAEETPGLLERLAAYRAGMWHLFNRAVENNAPHAASPVVSQLIRVEELIAQQTGELRARASAPVQHLHLTADFVRLRQTIMLALRPYPEALAAVAEALRQADITTAREPVTIEAAA